LPSYQWDQKHHEEKNKKNQKRPIYLNPLSEKNQNKIKRKGRLFVGKRPFLFHLLSGVLKSRKKHQHLRSKTKKIEKKEALITTNTKANYHQKQPLINKHKEVVWANAFTARKQEARTRERKLLPSSVIIHTHYSFYILFFFSPCTDQKPQNVVFCWIDYRSCCRSSIDCRFCQVGECKIQASVWACK
jgi:hypothetical protein